MFFFKVKIMETAVPFFGSTLRAYYRCDKIVKGALEGEILWTGPSEKHACLIETEPREFLTQTQLMDILKSQIFSSLKAQPYVQALLQDGDQLGLAQCDILYDQGYAWFLGHSKLNEDHLSENPPIAIEQDEFGSYAELWITMTLIVNSQDPAHAIPPLVPVLLLGPPLNCGDSGAIAAAEAKEAASPI
jgi:hypothetical protein